MRLPRWLVVSLLSLSVLAVLGYGAWWWVTWPDRTMRHVTELVRSENFDDALRMFKDAEMVDRKRELDLVVRGSPSEFIEVSPESRTLVDLIVSRRSFTSKIRLQFVVQYGKVQRIMDKGFWNY
jgi:hypothetical protein